MNEEYTVSEKISNVLSNHQEVEGQNYLGGPTRECAECGTYFPCLVTLAFEVLDSILGIPEDKTEFCDEWEDGVKFGYNKALELARKKIRGALQ
jgi:hypothetical protein